MLGVLLIFLLQGATGRLPPVATAAARYVPDVKWQPSTVITADFSCRGRKEQAILGTSPSEIVIAVFLSGTNHRPEVLRYSAEVRNATPAKLTIEGQELDPQEMELSGFRQSRTCKGLNLSDGMVDSVHIYWNHETHRFDDWVR